MVEIRCPKCLSASDLDFRIPPSGSGHYHELQGRLTCENDKFEWPIRVQSGRNQVRIMNLQESMPDRRSQDIVRAKKELIEDVQEAERAHAAGCEKGAAAMCRRALQLGLIDRGIPDGPLGEMLKRALSPGLATGKPVLTQDTYNLATSIQGFGDIAVHRNDELNSGDVALVIHATVRMLNELFP